MQSRLATIATRPNRIFSIAAVSSAAGNQALLRPPGFATATTNRTIDSDHEKDHAHEEHDHHQRPQTTGKEPDLYSNSGRPKSIHRSSPTLESTEVPHQPVDPTAQQKRRGSTSAAAAPDLLEAVSCAGLDGSPWPNDDVSREEQHEDNVEYFKHHKASPLSEIKVADTRKPITRATDGTADAEDFGGGPDVIGWSAEQVRSAAETLLMAARLWKERAARGDPDFPPSKVLRALRGENF